MILANYNMKLSINFDEIIMSEDESNIEEKISLILEFLYSWGKTASANYLQHSITKLKDEDLTSLLQTMVRRNWIENKEYDLGTITRTSYIISEEGRKVIETVGKFNNSI